MFSDNVDRWIFSRIHVELKGLDGKPGAVFVCRIYMNANKYMYHCKCNLIFSFVAIHSDILRPRYLPFFVPFADL